MTKPGPREDGHPNPNAGKLTHRIWQGNTESSAARGGIWVGIVGRGKTRERGVPGVAVADVADLHVLGPVRADEHVAGGPVHHGARHGSDGGVGGWQRRVGAGAGVAAALPWRPPGTTSTTAAAAAGPDWARSFRGWWAGRPAPFFTLLFFFFLSLCFFFFLFSLVLLRECRRRKKGRRGGVMRAVARF